MKCRLILVAALLAAAPSQAHHAINAQFDLTKNVPKVGVLTRLDNVNPHAYWHFDVKDASGKVEAWHIESVAPNALRRAGIVVKDTIKIGNTYNFSIAPARNGSTTGLMITVTVDGKTVRFVGGE